MWSPGEDGDQYHVGHQVNKLLMVMMLVGTEAGMDVVNGNVDKRNLPNKFKPIPPLLKVVYKHFNNKTSLNYFQDDLVGPR